MTEPYYSDEMVTIYHADCMDVLPQLGRFDLLLTDPPYGIGRSGQSLSVCANAKHNRKAHADYGWDTEAPDIRPFIDNCQHAVVWGATTSPRRYQGQWDGLCGIKAKICTSLIAN